MSNKNIRAHNDGFTLVELGIVMVIITLLTAGILVGQDLIKAATIKSTISQIENHQSNFNVFVDKFNAYPGDFNRATQFLGAIANANGDGDTQIIWNDNTGGGSSYYEGPLAWYHMKLAGLSHVQFSVPATLLASEDAVPSDVVPIASMGGDGAGYYINYVAGVGNSLGLGAYDGTGSGINDNDVMSPRDAQNIDRKIDDGMPSAGLVRGQGDTPADCFTVGTPTTYNVISEEVACYLEYKID